VLVLIDPVSRTESVTVECALEPTFVVLPNSYWLRNGFRPRKCTSIPGHCLWVVSKEAVLDGSLNQLARTKDLLEILEPNQQGQSSRSSISTRSRSRTV